MNARKALLIDIKNKKGKSYLWSISIFSADGQSISDHFIGSLEDCMIYLTDRLPNGYKLFLSTINESELK